jgi:hypothetical protein
VVTPILACVVCARPLDSLLTSGLQAGVAVLAVVTLVVIGALVRGVVAVVREDRRTGETTGTSASEAAR